MSTQPRKLDLPVGEIVAPHPPAWSPDGDRLAFVAYEGYSDSLISRESPLPVAVWTVGVDGAGLRRIADAASGPAWSPDGTRIAVAVPRGPNKASLYTFAADGSDPTFVSLDLPEPWDFPKDPWMGNLSWSPNGSSILFDQLALVVNLDDGQILFDGFAFLVRNTAGSQRFGGAPTQIIQERNREYLKRIESTPILASWSPDGNRITVFSGYAPSWERPSGRLYTMDRDGSNPRVLVEVVESDDGIELRLVQ